MIAFLIITAGYVLVPAPSHVSASTTTGQGAISTVLTSVALLPASQSVVTIAATYPPLPDRSAGCSICNANPGAVVALVQLDAAPFAGGAIRAGDVFSAAKTDAARTIAQRQPDALERPPAA